MRKNKFISIFFWVSFISLPSQFSVARSYDDIVESGEIIIAVYHDYPPFSFVDKNVEQGIDVDIAKIIAKQLGVDLKLRWINAGEKTDDDLRVNLWKRTKLNPVLSDIMMRVPYDQAYSQQRNDIGELAHKQVHMFAPYHTERWQIIFDKEKIEAVPTMALFQYHDIGVEVDSIPQFYLTSAFRGRMRDKAKQYNSIELAINAMKQGEVDAAMGLRSQVSYFQQKVGSQRYLLANNAFPLLGKQQWDIGMAIKSDYRQLGYAVGDIITALVVNNQMAQIFSQYNVIYQKPDFYLSTEK